MPGRYDNLSIPLSFMIQIFSFVSLIFVPIGIFWLIKTRTADKQEVTRKRFTKLTVVIAGLITIIVSIGAFSQNNTSLAILFLAISLFTLTKTFIKLNKDEVKSNSLLLYLIVIPLILVLMRYKFVSTAVQMSRATAIRNSEVLIQSIENYQKRNGYYPISLQALHYDISPNVVGIPQYFYEPNGDAYNVYFKQFSDELDMEEIVMYNKLNEHYFTAHSQDILEYEGDTLVLRRGDRRRFKLPADYWISIKFE